MIDKIRELELEIGKLKLQQVTEDSEEESAFSIWWFLFWLLVFWPVSIAYALYYHFKGK